MQAFLQAHLTKPVTPTDLVTTIVNLAKAQEQTGNNKTNENVAVHIPNN